MVSDSYENKTIGVSDGFRGDYSAEPRTFAASTSGPTIPLNDNKPGAGLGGGTVIRPAGGGEGTSAPGKKIVGILASYDGNSNGQIFNLLEGRNYIGRDSICDITIQNDSQVSGKHFSILYRAVDGKFKFKDEQSSNGTFINEMLVDEGELNLFDVIRIGHTRLVFIAIPQIQ